MAKNYQAKIISQKEIADNTIEVCLDLGEEMTFEAGQYVTVTVPGLEELPVIDRLRHFSIATSPSDPKHICIAFRKSDSAYKKKLLSMQEGEEVSVRGPKGKFILPAGEETPVIFLSGGVGITPFLSMMHEADEVNPKQKIICVTYNREEATSAYKADLEAIAKKHDQIEVIEYYGYVEKEQLAQLHTDYPSANWYTAGPPKMVDIVLAFLDEIGVDQANIKTEAFTGI